MRPALLCLLALPLVAVAAPVPKALKKPSDAKLIEGVWHRVSLDRGDGQLNTTKHWIQVTGDQFLRGEESGPAYLFAAVALDPTQSPKHLDVIRDGAVTVRYIYHLDGDTLTLSHGPSDQPRPTEFKGGDGQYCSVWKRAKE
jgi:uncharacterized protein (TIGR03067 family)